MRRLIVLSVVVLATCCVSARADDQHDMKAALQKLSDAPNCSWKSTSKSANGTGESTGKIQKGGLVWLSLVQPDRTYEAFIKGDRAVVKMQDGWKSLTELARGDGNSGGKLSARVLAILIKEYHPPLSQALDSADKLQDCSKMGTVYTANLTEDAAKELIYPGNKENGNAPQVSNAKASIIVTVKGEIAVKLTLHITGTVNSNGNNRDVDRMLTTEFTDIGTTNITLPDEAKAKLGTPKKE